MLLIKICRKFVCPPAVLGSRFNASIRNFSAEHCMGSCREILVDFAGCNVTKIVVGCSSKEVQVCCYCLDCKQPTKISQHFVHQRECSTKHEAQANTSSSPYKGNMSGANQPLRANHAHSWYVPLINRRTKLSSDLRLGPLGLWKTVRASFGCCQVTSVMQTY